MKEITIRVADSVYKELLTTMKFKKIMSSFHGIEDEFVLLVLFGIESGKKTLIIDEKQKNENVKISDDLKEVMLDVKKGRKSGNSKHSVGRKI
jgi:hypothetical protein